MGLRFSSPTAPKNHRERERSSYTVRTPATLGSVSSLKQAAFAQGGVSHPLSERELIRDGVRGALPLSRACCDEASKKPASSQIPPFSTQTG
jgi:hypothetical protein